MKERFNNVKTLLKLTVITSAFIYAYNGIIIYNASIKKRLVRTTNKRYYRSSNGNLFYTIHGEGSPLLLIHDLTAGGSGYEWKRVEQELSKNHTVYTIDLPGCGRSEKKKQIYTNYYYVQMIGDFIQNIIKKKTNIIASGYSCSIAIMLNKQIPGYVRKMILVNPCSLKKYSKNATNKDIVFYHILRTPIFGTLIYHMLVSHENIDNLFIEHYYYNPFHLDTDMEDVYYEASHKYQSFSKYVYASLVRNYTGCNVGSALRFSNETNVRLFFGESEPNYKEIIHEYQDVIPALNATVIQHTKHFPHIEQVQAFLDNAEDFLLEQ